MAVRVEPELESRHQQQMYWAGLKLKRQSGALKEVALPRASTAPKGHAHVHLSSKHAVATQALDDLGAFEQPDRADT